MRIVVLADRLSARGGADQHLLDVLRRLTDHGSVGSVELITGVDDGTAGAPCVHRLLPGLEVRGEQAVAGLLDDEALSRADVVHLHNIVNPWILEAAERWPALATVQDHRVFCPGQGKLRADGERCTTALDLATCSVCLGDARYGARLHALTRRRCEALQSLRGVVVLSRYMKRELAAVGVDPERVFVVPPFVDLDSLRGGAGEPSAVGQGAHVLFVGRLVQTKGVDDAIAAWQSSGVELPLCFVGTGSQRQRLEEAGFEVTGWLDRRRLGERYGQARALLFPSRWQEPFGIVGLEALSLGVPVAAYDSGGVAEWHPGPSAGLVPWGDVEALAEALREMVEAPAPVAAPEGFDGAALTEGLLAVYRLIAG